MAEVKVSYINIYVKLRNDVNWNNVYIPIGTPNAYSVIYDDRDPIIPTDESKWKTTESLRASIAPELFEGFESWTRKYTDDNTTLTIEINFSNIEYARAYCTKVIEFKKQFEEICARPVDKDFQFLATIKNRNTRQLYPLHIDN
jgi:hypothetical protein